MDVGMAWLGRRARVALLGALAVMAVAVAAWLPPIAQDQAYHVFADRRTMLGVPNFLNVVSNVAFLVVGAVGLALPPRAHGGNRWRFGLLATGVTLTGVGSAAYHLAPSDATLVWDRLPLSLVFGAFFALVIEDRLTGPRNKLFALLAVLGPASVLYWRLTDDLRLYGLVQFFPLLAIPLILALFPGGALRAADLVAVLLWYGAAKVAEVSDADLFAAGEIVSGHTLKHVLAAIGAGRALLMLARRGTSAGGSGR
jgi:hypothetical protein